MTPLIRVFFFYHNFRKKYDFLIAQDLRDQVAVRNFWRARVASSEILENTWRRRVTNIDARRRQTRTHPGDKHLPPSSRRRSQIQPPYRGVRGQSPPETVRGWCENGRFCMGKQFFGRLRRPKTQKFSAACGGHFFSAPAAGWLM